MARICNKCRERFGTALALDLHYGRRGCLGHDSMVKAGMWMGQGRLWMTKDLGHDATADDWELAGYDPTEEEAEAWSQVLDLKGPVIRRKLGLGGGVLPPDSTEKHD